MGMAPITATDSGKTTTRRSWRERLAHFMTQRTERHEDNGTRSTPRLCSFEHAYIGRRYEHRDADTRN